VVFPASVNYDRSGGGRSSEEEEEVDKCEPEPLPNFSEVYST